MDYKASAKLHGDFEKDISRFVSAYANTAGGFIIFGVADPVAGQALECDGGFPVRHKNGAREWLEDKIKGIVKPALTRFNVYELLPTLGMGSKITPGNAIYVLEIPPAQGRARQAQDGRYYAKAGSKTRILDDEEIHRLNARGPEVSATVDVRIQPHKSIDSTLIATFKNTGPSIIQDLRLELQLPPEIVKIGCFSCEQSEFLIHEAFPWIKIVVTSLGHPLFPDQTEVRKWYLEYQSGVNFEGANGKWSLPPPDIGYSTLWIGNLPPTRQKIDFNTAVIAPLFFQPPRQRSLV